ncbi:hypothetical protein AV650_15305 [Serratia fonticola]|nr:hypothetical protein AV650_15305 [Serratia fonticola]
MTTQKDNAMDAMQDFFPNGGREWDAIGALYDAIAAGKIPGVVTGEKVAELEQRLQQPIKLPKREIGMACEFVSDHIVVSLAALLAEAETAGFKAEVEGE